MIIDLYSTLKKDIIVFNLWDDIFLWTVIVRSGGTFCTSEKCQALSIKELSKNCYCSYGNIFGYISFDEKKVYNTQELQILKLHTSQDRSFRGNQLTGISSIRIKPDRNYNDISKINDEIDPHILVMGTGGRKQTTKGKGSYELTNHLTLDENSAFFHNLKYMLPIRVFVLDPWDIKIKSKKYKYIGMWRVKMHYAIEENELTIFQTKLIPFIKLNYSITDLNTILRKANYNLNK